MKRSLLLLVVVLSLFVRFYNFQNRMTFGPEQAISLIASGAALKNGITLLGIPNLQRFTSDGYQLFSGAWFTYSLVPLHYIFNGNPIAITVYFALLNVITALIFFVLLRKVFNYKTAIIFLVLFLFSSVMIYHSLFIWILNYLPLVGGLSCYLAYILKSKPDRLSLVFWLGVLSGVGFNLEYFYLLSAAVFFLLTIFWSRKKLFAALIFLVGGVVGNLPMAIFDLRHNFYHLTTLWKYFLDIFKYHADQKLAYYHFLNWFPLAFLVLALIIQRFFSKRQIVIVLALYVFVNLFSNRISFERAVGMQEGLTWAKINKVANVIMHDVSGNFNVVTLLDFDTRGHILRYPLEYLYGKTPLEVEEYRQASAIYALAKKDYNFSDSKVWELEVFAPYEVEIMNEIEPNYGVYKLTKK